MSTPPIWCSPITVSITLLYVRPGHLPVRLLSCVTTGCSSCWHSLGSLLWRSSSSCSKTHSRSARSRTPSHSRTGRHSGELEQWGWGPKTDTFFFKGFFWGVVERNIFHVKDRGCEWGMFISWLRQTQKRNALVFFVLFFYLLTAASV